MGDMRILFIAMADSVHTARWIGQLQGVGWDVHLFPACWPCRIHPQLRDVTVHGVGWWRPPELAADLRVAGVWPFSRGAWMMDQAARRLGLDRSRAAQLAGVIRSLKPHVVHSLEMQRAGYLTLQVRQLLQHQFPPWIYSAWGSDLSLFGRQPEHTERVKSVMASCNYFISDCNRDVCLATDYGFRGKVLGVVPGGGGFDLASLYGCRAEGSVSRRLTIAVKGYHEDLYGGRALVALQAIHRCAELLRPYEIVVYSASQAVQSVVHHIRIVSGLDISVLSQSAHVDMLHLMGRSRVAIGLGLSDGTPNTMLEAMLMGALPIQSNTGAADEWIRDGENGLLVPPEDVMKVEQAIRRAVADDTFVDRADEINAGIARERLDSKLIKPQVLEMYRKAGRSC